VFFLFCFSVVFFCFKALNENIKLECTTTDCLVLSGVMMVLPQAEKKGKNIYCGYLVFR